MWSEELPLGLFYDESPHVFYLLRRFGRGDSVVVAARAIPSRSKLRTPQILDIELSTPIAPAHVYINFESPVCEWYFTVFGDSHVANVDLFRDILTVLPNDGQHLMKEVFRTSALLTWHHWKGFLTSGVRYVCRRLHYGMDVTHRNFHTAIFSHDRTILQNMDGVAGLAVNRAQHDVIALVNETINESGQKGRPEGQELRPKD
jgi:scyllo-inositol 2-dehydrogenase (NADP+)